MRSDACMFEAQQLIGTCWECGVRDYVVKSRVSCEGVKCDAINCADCWSDILAASRMMQNKLLEGGS
jgi:hypothetical protein